MKLRLNNFQNDISLFDGTISIIEIKNVKYYSKLIQSINDKINGYETDEIILLSDSDELLKFEKEVMMVIDLYNVDFNSKKIITKIYSSIANNIKGLQNNDFEEIIRKLRHYIDLELIEMPFEFQLKENIEIEEILKVFSIKLEPLSYQTVFEKLELLIDIISNLKLASILILPNLKLYLSTEELIEIYKYSMYNEIKLVLIERKNDSKLKYEQTLCIDENFDDYIY